EPEIRALHERLLKRTRVPVATVEAETLDVPGRDRPVIPVDAREGFFEVELARLALAVEAIPVEEPKSGVARLLHLGHQDPAAGGMDRAGGKEDTVAGSGLELVQALDNLTLHQGGSKRRRIDPGLQARVNATSRGRVEDEPGFRLAPLAGPEPAHRLVVG